MDPKSTKAKIDKTAEISPPFGRIHKNPIRDVKFHQRQTLSDDDQVLATQGVATASTEPGDLRPTRNPGPLSLQPAGAPSKESDRHSSSSSNVCQTLINDSVLKSHIGTGENAKTLIPLTSSWQQEQSNDSDFPCDERVPAKAQTGQPPRRKNESEADYDHYVPVALPLSTADPSVLPVTLHENLSHYPQKTVFIDSVGTSEVPGETKAPETFTANGHASKTESTCFGQSASSSNRQPTTFANEYPLLNIVSFQNFEKGKGFAEAPPPADITLDAPKPQIVTLERGPVVKRVVLNEPQNVHFERQSYPKTFFSALTKQPESIKPATPPPSYFECIKQNLIDVRSPYPGGRSDGPSEHSSLGTVSQNDIELQIQDNARESSRTFRSGYPSDLLLHARALGESNQQSTYYGDGFSPFAKNKCADSTTNGSPGQYRRFLNLDSSSDLLPSDRTIFSDRNDQSTPWIPSGRRAGRFAATSDHEALAFLACIMCWPLGLIAIYFSNESRAFHSDGKLEEADKAARFAFTVSIFGLCIGTIVYISWFVYQHI